MQLLVVSIAFVGLCSTSLIQCQLTHFTTVKSFSGALQECAEYLEVSNCTLKRYIVDSYPECEVVKKLIHCTLLNLVAWDETGLKQQVMDSFFEPAPGDTCYKNRTAECIRKVVVNHQDKFNQAYEAFQCYYRNYGNIREVKQWIPSTPIEFAEQILVAFTVVNVPRCERIQYARGNIFGQPTFPRAFFACHVRAGFYSLQKGILLDSFYTYFGLPQILSPQTAECVATVEMEYCEADHATRFLETFKNCLADIIPAEDILRGLMVQEVGIDLSGCV